MVGHSRHSAPRSERRFTSSLACSRALVTTILRPIRGRFSNHFILSLNFTTWPTTITAGGLRPAFFARSEIVSSFPVTVVCLGVVPQRIRATGVSGSIPWLISRFVIYGRFLTPIKNTMVPIPLASAVQSILDSSFKGSSCPVTKARVDVNFL